MNLPLILISLDDASIGIFADKRYVISEIEAPDIDNYKIFDKEGIELEIKITRKQFLCLFLGNHIDITYNVISSKKDPETLIEYIIRKLDHFNISIRQDMTNNLAYLLDLLVKIKGYNKMF